MEKALLLREIVNNLFYSQYEQFRAFLHVLGGEDPGFAINLLYSILHKGGRLQGLLWSESIPSASHLAWLCLRDYDTLQNKVGKGSWTKFVSMTHACELLLYVGELGRCLKEEMPLSETNDRSLSASVQEDCASTAPSGPSVDAAFTQQADGSGFQVLEQVCTAIIHLLRHLGAHEHFQGESEPECVNLGLNSFDPQGQGARTMHGLGASHGQVEAAQESRFEAARCFVDSSENVLEKLTLAVPEILSAFCKASAEWVLLPFEMVDSACPEASLKAQCVSMVGLEGLCDTTRSVFSLTSGDDMACLHALVRITVPMAHLRSMRKNLNAKSMVKAAQHLRYLNESFLVAHPAYRDVIKLLLMEAFKEACGDHFWQTAGKLKSLRVVLSAEILASGGTSMCLLLESMQDNVLREEATRTGQASEVLLSALLHCMHNHLRNIHAQEMSVETKTQAKDDVFVNIKCDIFQNAYVHGAQAIGEVVHATLLLLDGLQFHAAADVLAPFPHLQPVVAVMGWDLLFAKTSALQKMVQILWVCRAEFTHINRGADGLAAVEYLCEELRSRLEVAYFVSDLCVGWTSKRRDSIFNSARAHIDPREEIANGEPTDPFVANLVLEHLQLKSTMRVIFQFLPDINSHDALFLLGKQPSAPSAVSSMEREGDLELIHMYFGIMAAIRLLCILKINVSMIPKVAVAKEDNGDILSDVQEHLEQVSTPARWLWMLNAVVSICYSGLEGVESKQTTQELEADQPAMRNCLVGRDVGMNAGSLMHMSVMVEFLTIVKSILSAKRSSARLHCDMEEKGSSTSWAGRASQVEMIVDDWSWRLEAMHRLTGQRLPWTYVLVASPSTFLNICVQNCCYDLGRDTLDRFDLPTHEVASLLLAEWIDRVEASKVRYYDGISIPNDALDSVHDATRSALLNAILCLDFCIAYSWSIQTSLPLLNEASKTLAVNEGKHVLSEKLDITCVSKHLVDHIREVFSKDQFRSLQTEFIRPDTGADARQGSRLRALLLLQQVIGDASGGKRQFLSGKLHNIVKALADDEADDIGVRPDVDSKQWQFEAGVALGLGFAVIASLGADTGVSQPSGELVPSPVVKGGRRWLNSLGSKPMAFLSAFTLYIATIGDIVDGVDTTHDFNFFSLMFQSPKDLLTRLSFEEISFDAAVKVAEIMGVDLVQHVISVSAHCVHPPYAAKGWATIHEALYLKLSLWSNIGGLAKETGYNLWLDGIKHLMTVSPPRAILVCVFGNNRCPIWSEDCVQAQQDRDRALFEFTLEQSENFPILNRWIQMQVNLQRLSCFPNNQSCKNYDKMVAGRKTLKRLHSRLDEPQERQGEQSLRTPQEDLVENLGSKKEVTQHELEVANLFQVQMIESSEAYQAQGRGQLNLKTAGSCSVSELSFDWESRGPYEDAVWRLVVEGKLMDALALADRWLCDGAPDQLLELLVEKGQGSAEQSTHWYAQGAHSNSWNNSWQYCIRLRDKNLAAQLALRYLDGWELAAAIDVLTMCKCQLLPNEPQYWKVSERRDALLQFSRIMQADAEFVKWQEVELLSRIDPEGLALRLSGKGAVLEALEIAESFRLPSPLRTELQGRHLVKIFQAGPVEGGGSASGLKFLLQHSENAFPIAMAALEQLPDLQSKQLLVQFISKNHAGMLSKEDHLKVDQVVLSLRMLGALPLPWQNRCSALHAHPKLIFETLLMWKQWRTALELLQTFPSLKDDALVIAYAAKAISVSPPVIAETSPAPVQASGKWAHPAVPELHLKSTPGNRHWDGRSASATLMTEHDGISKHKNSSAVSSPEGAAWAPMSGLVDEHLAGLVPEGYGRTASVALAEDWVLTGDPARDECVRSLHHFENAPCAILFKSLLSLCSEEVAIRAAVDLCVAQAERLLGAEHLTPTASLESIERAYSAAGVFISILQGADRQMQVLRADEKDKMAELLDSVHQWLHRMAVLQCLLGARVSASLDDIGHMDESMQLRDRLLAEERYSLALSICAKLKVDAFPAWNAWGHTLLSIGRYSQAREKFQQAMQCVTSDPTPVVRQIVFAIEAGPPADVSAVNDLYFHMANNVYSSSDDSLSADSYLNVLHVPSFQKTEKARWSIEDSPDSPGRLLSTIADDHVLQSNLDDSHFEECMLYLKAFCRQDVLSFAFQHGRYTQACQIMLPSNGMQPRALLSLHQMQAPSPSPQRVDSLATEYGSVDDLCEFCVGYSTIPVLEHTLATVASNQVPDAHVLLAASLQRVCNYCEVHRHFNHLYRFQLLKKDHVAAGLCQIQLFQFSLMQEEAVQHLEQAKVHFDEGLLARQAGEGAKNVGKVNRVRSPAEKLTEEELIKFSARVGLQVDVTRSLCDTERRPWMYSLFGNPNDADTLKRRCEVVEALLDKTFDLAFKIIYEFSLPRIHIYAGFAASLAAKKKSHHLTEFFHNIRGTIGDEDLDQILGAAISVYVHRHEERPDQLIEMISSSHRKVLALVICGRLKAAFQIASKSGSVSDVQYVAHQAQFLHASAVVKLCKNWLRQVAMFP